MPLRQALVGSGVTFAIAAITVNLWDPSYALPLVVGSAYTAVLNLSGAPGERLRGMGWAVIWLSLATLAGGLISPFRWVELAAIAAVGLVGGYIGVIGRRPTVISVLAMSIFAVFAGLDFTVEQSFKFAALMAAGGCIQILVWLGPILVRHSHDVFGRTPDEGSWVQRLTARSSEHNHYARHAIRLSAALLVGSVIADQLDWPHPYWIPMTIAIMSKPDADGTTRRIIERIIGTLLGVAAAIFLIAVVGDGGLLVPIYAAVGVGVLLAFQTARYAIAVAGMTVLIMTMMTYLGDPILETATVRVVATALAGVITIAAVLVVWLWARRQVSV